MKDKIYHEIIKDIPISKKDMEQAYDFCNKKYF